MTYSWLNYFLSIGIAALASFRFFSWPAPTRKLPIYPGYLLIAILLWFLPSFLFTTADLPFDAHPLSLGSILLTCLFALYLFALPLDMKYSVLYSGKRPESTFLKAIGSAFRMWLIVIPATATALLTLSSLFTYFFPAQSLRNQTIVQEVETLLASQTYTHDLILSVCVLVPIIEEVFFRGVIQTYLKNKLSRTLALIMSSAIFACIHIEKSWGSLIFIPTLFVFSLAAGFLYEKERNIVAPITLHMLYNWTTVMMAS